MASGSVVSAARAPVTANTKSAAVAMRGLVMLSPVADPATTNPRVAYLCHRLRKVVRNLVEEAGGRQPALVGADQEREVLGHGAGLDSIDADRLQRVSELRELRIVVELGAVGEATGPGEDRGDRIGRCLLALLVLAVVAGHRA